jgi:hypothetical protein
MTSKNKRAALIHIKNDQVLLCTHIEISFYFRQGLPSVEGDKKVLPSNQVEKRYALCVKFLMI